ncbi:hypothetical protein [Legionella rowbothamii]|uniref:hypothetical protein n=1 Tax=Legionella rowbothamii TaxID=96229 RepID=UPI00105447E4|nr:hypothetical protein [Legionella rowbothamii]
MKFFSESPTVLKSLGLYSNEIQYLLEKLTGKKAWVSYKDDEDNILKIQIIRRKNGTYFALVDATSLCGLEDKALFIRKGVEFALRQKGLDIPFTEIAVGGLVSDEGRLGIFSKLLGKRPPAVHEYVAFKLPGESQVLIEDPRTGIFDWREKFQSRTDNQVCCFAASAIFFASCIALKRGDAPNTTRELFDEIYKNEELRGLIQQLENKVGYSTETKKQVIDSFVKTLISFPFPRLDKKEENELEATLSTLKV